LARSYFAPIGPLLGIRYANVVDDLRFSLGRDHGWTRFTSYGATRRSNWISTSTTAAALAGEVARAANQLRHHEWLKWFSAQSGRAAAKNIKGIGTSERIKPPDRHRIGSPSIRPRTKFVQSKPSRRRLIRQKRPFRVPGAARVGIRDRVSPAQSGRLGGELASAWIADSSMASDVTSPIDFHLGMGRTGI
jgi:hypothetical protein